jgi:cellobiose phosphorylase
MLVVHDLLGYRPDLSSIRLAPNLPPSVRRVKANLRHRGHTLALDITNGGGPLRSVRVDGKAVAHDGRTVEVPPLEHDVRVRMIYGDAR